VPSLAEVAAREIGWALEQEVEGALADGAHGSGSDDADEEAEALTYEEEGDCSEANSSFSSIDDAARDVLGGRERTDYDLERQSLTEEWYQAGPDFTRG
jgi:hypothetical protein